MSAPAIVLGGGPQDGAGYAYALALSPRQTAATVSDVGVVSLLGSHNKLVGVGHTCGLFYLLVGGVLHTEGYVGTYGVVEQDSLLVDVAHEAAEVACAEVPHILAAHFHTSFLGVVETGQQVYESTLARAALSHEGDSLSRHVVKPCFRYLSTRCMEAIPF